MNINEEKLAAWLAISCALIGAALGVSAGGLGGAILYGLGGVVVGLMFAVIVCGTIDAIPQIKEALFEILVTAAPFIVLIGLIVLGVTLWDAGAR